MFNIVRAVLIGVVAAGMMPNEGFYYDDDLTELKTVTCVTKNYCVAKSKSGVESMKELGGQLTAKMCVSSRVNGYVKSQKECREIKSTTKSTT